MDIIEEAVEETNLRYINEAATKGISRQASGKNFKYLDPDGRAMRDKKTLKRIKELVVPPAWKDVWISPSPNTHLQATGIDEKGRKQYLYHPKWIAFQQENKFSRMSDFGKTLPKIRNKIREDMYQPSLSRERVLATVVWLLEHTFIRIGNPEYARENDSFGLTTLRERHVEVSGEEIKFEFVGKSGVRHSLNVQHPRVAKTIKRCLELPGYEIFRYLDDDGEKKTIDSEDVNNYLKEVTGEDITAKDYRTWGGTLLSAVYLKDLGPFKDEKQSEKNIAEAIKKVSKDLGNKPSTCRNYYVHPAVLETYRRGILIPHFEKAAISERPPGITKEEFAVITLISEYS